MICLKKAMIFIAFFTCITEKKLKNILRLEKKNLDLKPQISNVFIFKLKKQSCFFNAPLCMCLDMVGAWFNLYYKYKF